MEGPDHKASIMPDDLKVLCESVRRAEVIIGDGKKRVTDSERKNKKNISGIRKTDDCDRNRI